MQSGASTKQPDGYGLVEVREVSGFIERCLVASGALQSHVVSLASVLVHADIRGHYSHGLNRLGKMIDNVAILNFIEENYYYYRDVL